MEVVAAIGLAASLAQLIKVALKSIEFLNDVKNAPKERALLTSEVMNLLALLTSLRSMVEMADRSDPWLTSVYSLGAENGPMDQFRQILEELAKIMAEKSGMAGCGEKILWKLEKKKVNDILTKMERLKSIFSFAVQKDQLALSRAIRDSVSNVESKVISISQSVTGIRKKDYDDEFRSCLAWLSPHDFSSGQTDILDRRMEGTGAWFLDSEAFKGWIAGTERTLWCPGMPGGGKTVICSIVVDHLKKSQELKGCAVICIYCSYKEHEMHSVANLLASFLQQLIRARAFIPDALMEMYKSNAGRPSVTDLSKMIRTLVSMFPRVFAVIDALDECLESKNTRDGFLTEIRALEPVISLMATSRESQSIERVFEGAACYRITATDTDIKSYVTYRLQQDRRLNSVIGGDERLKDQIVSDLVQKARGMFLMARLHLDRLTGVPNKRDLRIALERLPEELYQMYGEAMQRINSRSQELVKLAKNGLSWLCNAFGHLTVLELRHALAIEPGTSSFDEDGLVGEDVLVSACEGLVVVDTASGIIRLVHYTTREYLKQDRANRIPHGHTNIAIDCLTYLSYRTFESGPIQSKQERESIYRKYPLYGYASRYWPFHASPMSKLDIENHVIKFQSQKSKWDASIQAVNLTSREIGHDEDSSFSLFRNIGFSEAAILSSKALAQGEGSMMSLASEPIFSGIKPNLEFMAQWGYDVIAARSVERDHVLHPKVLNGSTWLTNATYYNDVTWVNLLLEKGANVNAINASGLSELAHASALGHITIVEILLRQGADINPTCSAGVAPLHVAIVKEQYAVVKILLENGANVNLVDTSMLTPLISATTKGNHKIAKLLLEYGANVNATCLERPPILVSLAQKNEEMAILFLENGVNPNERLVLEMDPLFSGPNAGIGCSPATAPLLHFAVHLGTEAIVEKLLDKGADINGRCSFGTTALDAARQEGDDAMVSILVRAGAVDDQGPSPADLKSGDGLADLDTADEGKTTITLCERGRGQGTREMTGIGQEGMGVAGGRLGDLDVEGRSRAGS